MLYECSNPANLSIFRGMGFMKAYPDKQGKQKRKKITDYKEYIEYS